MAVGGPLGAAGLFDLGTGRWIAAPGSVDRENVVGVSFAPDAATFITSSADGTVRVWNGRTGEQVAALRVPGELSAAAAAAVSGTPDVLVAARNGSVYRLDTTFSTWIGFACSTVGRNLTPAEWKAVFSDQPYHATCPAG